MDLRTDSIQKKLVSAVDAALSGTRGPIAELAAIGIPGLSLSESLGGYELGISADVVVNSRLGYALEPVPACRETVFALELVHPNDVPSGFREDVFDGTAQAAVIGLNKPADLRVDAAGRLWGVSEDLPDGQYGFIVARAATVGGGVRWLIVVPDEETTGVSAGIRLGLPCQQLSFHGTPTHTVVVPDEVLRRARERARVRQAAVLLGVADRALALARTHVNRRIQYGSPLLKLQTVAHRLARLVGISDGWRLALHETAWRYDRGVSRHGDGTRCLAVAVEHAFECTRLGIQLHGVRGVLAHSSAATAYRIASIEGIRMGTPQAMWLEAGRALADDIPGWRVGTFAVVPAEI